MKTRGKESRDMAWTDEQRMNEPVCVVWKEGSCAATIAYCQGKGRIRTYLPGQLDGRIGPVAETWDEDEFRFYFEQGCRCQVPVAVVRRVFGWSPKRFAEVCRPAAIA